MLCVALGYSRTILIYCGLGAILAFSGCAGIGTEEKARWESGAGRARVTAALSPPQVRSAPVDPGPVSALQSGDGVDLEQPVERFPAGEPAAGRMLVHELSDGTTVGGILFEYAGRDDEQLPLVMAGFGFLQDRWGGEAFRFYDQYVAGPIDAVPAHILILDHPSSGPFLAENGVLSMGAYDDARIWIDVARRLKKKNPELRIHLFGAGMSGQTVVHALVEDQRLGMDLFESGLAVSIAPDLKRVPGRQLALFDSAAGEVNPWRSGLDAELGDERRNALQRRVLMRVIEKQFIAHYLRLNPTHLNFSLPPERVPLFFHSAFENRLELLRTQPRIPDTWNYAVIRLDSLDAFMQTTRIAGVIQEVQTPLVLLSARDDPAVPYSQFQSVAEAAAGNTWVLCHAVDHGGHFAFAEVYGKAYLGRVLRLMLDQQVLEGWLRQN
jgi:hypothetical protein